MTEYRGYRGASNIKGAGVNIEWTPELVQEYLKCSHDPIYFAKNYVKVIHPDKGIVPFVPYDFQEEMLLSMCNNRFSIFCTARQIGKSLTACVFLLWYILFNESKTAAVLANKEMTAIEILGRVQLAYQYLPPWLQQGVVEWNKKSFILENNSKILAGATSPDSLRGFTINCLYLDETAFIEGWEKFSASIIPTVSASKTSKIIMTSTPNSLNHFYSIWQLAIDGKNEYNPVKVTWNQVPGRDEKWKEQTLASMNYNLEQFRQEQEVEFLGSAGTLIAGWKLQILKHQIPVLARDGMYSYKKPEKDHKYVLVADVSRGSGLDYSAFSVIDVTTMPYEQVCTYKNNLITPIDYAEIIHQVAKKYNEAQVLVETNDIGEQVCDVLYYDYEYVNLVHTVNAGRDGKRISQGFGAKSNVDKGVRTTKKVKNIGCSILKLLVENDGLIVNDENTIYELATFAKKNDSYCAEEGKHDDLVMGLVLFAWMTEQTFFKEMTDINTLSKLRQKTDEEIMSDITPFFVLDGENEEQIDFNGIMVTPEPEIQMG